ncbi:hypothetical protein [Clostridium botulinum]|uniref:hypothetical protein n=1 Tax=Clostridium botulinum TaxID=1491 RepID=UPI0014000625|nr:hypothetical protein [Clostridium botulinum]MBN1050439.1 hypothetical protein [Clostridium botulinum]NFI54734.1 hypothetical protein [Clostridium botulinum]
MNDKISNVVGNIVSGLAQHKKAVLVTTSDNNNDTIELTIDENNVRIYIHKKGIRITANTTQGNLSLGLKETSYKTRCYKIFTLDSYEDVTNVILNLK